ncbi:MAG: hypothetical protein FJ315_01830 [SAR202 cluster bacterium]|nr:hypothetical protein [SAR202 cluster bacterium]
MATCSPPPWSSISPTTWGRWPPSRAARAARAGRDSTDSREAKRSGPFAPTGALERSPVNAVQLLRVQAYAVRDAWAAATDGLTGAEAFQHPPGGQNPIAAILLHASGLEDLTVQRTVRCRGHAPRARPLGPDASGAAGEQRPGRPSAAAYGRGRCAAKDTGHPSSASA